MIFYGKNADEVLAQSRKLTERIEALVSGESLAGAQAELEVHVSRLEEAVQSMRDEIDAIPARIADSLEKVARKR